MAKEIWINEANPMRNELPNISGLYMIGNTLFNPHTKEEIYLLKIGKSTTIANRMKSYRTTNPLIFHIDYKEVKGGSGLLCHTEKTYQEVFLNLTDGQHIEGCEEWIKITRGQYLFFCEKGFHGIHLNFREELHRLKDPMATFETEYPEEETPQTEIIEAEEIISMTEKTLNEEPKPKRKRIKRFDFFKKTLDKCFKV